MAEANGEAALEVDDPPADPQLQRALHKAFVRRRLPEFLALLRAGPDLEHAYEDEQVTLLMLACARAGYGEFAAALLAAGADPNTADGSGRTALHYAAYQSNQAALELLLADKRTDVRAVDREGSSALHYTAAPSWTIRDTGQHLRCIALLMDQPGFEVNRPDGIGQTAITTAVLLHFPDRIRVMLEHGRERLNLDCSRVTNGKSVREVIRQRFPELRRFLPPPRAESLAAADPHAQLLAALQHRDLPAFGELLRSGSVDPNRWYDDPYYCTCLELACRRRGAEDFVRALVGAGADPDTRNRIYGLPALHQAAESANSAALEVLLRAGARVDARDPAGHTALHVAAQKQCAEQAEAEAVQECIALLLDREDLAVDTLARANWYDTVDAVAWPSIDIDAQDEFGDTALHDAAHYGNKEVVLSLLRRGANVMKKNQEGDPPLAFIDSATLDTFLDEQIKSNGLSPLSDDYQVIIRYTFLEPSSEQETSAAGSEMDALRYISRSEDLRRLLRHPVINSFLFLKWHMLRGIFYANLFVYVLFVTLLTSYVLLINVNDENYANCTAPNGTVRRFSARMLQELDPGRSTLQLHLECRDPEANCTGHGQREVVLSDMGELRVNRLLWDVLGREGKNCVRKHDDPSKLSPEEFAAHCLRVPIFYLILLLLLREGLQVAMSWRRYLKDPENPLELSIIVVSSIALSSDWEDSTFKQHISAVAILLSWAELVLMTGRLPFLCVQLEMFKKVSFTFLRFMAWYSLFIVAFALSFYTLFRRSSDYDPEGKEKFFFDPALSIMRTIIMMVGEFEATDLVFEAVPGTSHVVFVIFVILIAIILLNLLNGLAVYDTQAIKEDAVILGLVSMVHLVSYLESMLKRLTLVTNFFYKGCYKDFLDTRVNLFKSDLKKKQIHAFPSTGEIKFLLDAETTARFDAYRMARDILRQATDIVTEKKELTALEEIKRRIAKNEDKFKEIQRSQNKTHELLQEVLRGVSGTAPRCGSRESDL